MPSYIIKDKPDVDWYCFWSEVVDNWTAYGDRAEMERCLSKKEADPERFDRADRTGTSALWEFVDEPGRHIYDWDDDGFVVTNIDGHEGFYWLKRKHLREWVETQNHDLLITTEEANDHTP